MKSTATLLLSILLSLVLLEAGSRLILSWQFGLGLKESTDYIANLVSQMPSFSSEEKSANELNFNEGRKLHPFFGYVSESKAEGVNNLGFHTPEKFPYQKQDGEFVVGGFGGSLAQQFFMNQKVLRRLEKVLLQLLAPKGYSKITFMNFAVSTWRQPQQFYALIHYMRDVDIAITIDGFNEVTNIYNNLDRNIPIDFPNGGMWSALTKSAMSVAETKDLVKIYSKSEKVRQSTKFLGSFSASLAFRHVLWHVANQSELNELAKLRKDFQKSNYWSDYDTTPFDKEEIVKTVDRYLGFYRDNIRHAHLIAQAMGKKSYHFIQPNQYVPDSKVFSDEEKKNYLTDKELAGTIPTFYKKLVGIQEELANEGVMVYELTKVFDTTSATVYRDPCCHVNEKGNFIIANAVSEKLLDTMAEVSH